MDFKFIVDGEAFEQSIKILESRAFLDSKEARILMMKGLCCMKTFKQLMREPGLEHHLFSYLEQFCQQAIIKHIPRGGILYHDGDSLDQLFFVLRGSFTEFHVKSETELKLEVFWDSQAGKKRDEIAQLSKNQLQLQERKQKEQKESIQKSVKINQSRQVGNSDETLVSLREVKRLKSKLNLSQKGRSAHVPLLDEKYISPEFTSAVSRLKEKDQLYSQTAKYVSTGIELLKLENRLMDKYFLEGRCLYKKVRDIFAGDNFGQLLHLPPDSFDTQRSNKTQQQTPASSRKHQLIRNTAVCSQSAFILQISSDKYQRIFGQLTERLNFVSQALAGTFPDAKQIILSGFAFQFEEVVVGLNETLFNQGELPQYVYIMKSGEIDYRKNFSQLNGQQKLKRFRMVNQGELFGIEDIFERQRLYSVQSCVQNSVYYRIPKECLMVFQFIQPFKAASKARAEMLKVKLDELQMKSETHLISVSTTNQVNQKQENSLNVNSSMLTSTTQNFEDNRQVMLNPMMSISQERGVMNATQQSSASLKSFSRMKAIAVIKPGFNEFFQHTQNANLSENDFELTFKAVSPFPTMTSLPHSDSTNVGNKITNQQFSIPTFSVMTARAQPESVYSRTVRPDSAFKEELQQIKRDQAMHLIRFKESQIKRGLFSTELESLQNQSMQNSQPPSSNSLTRSRKYSANATSRKSIVPDFKLNKLQLFENIRDTERKQVPMASSPVQQVRQLSRYKEVAQDFFEKKQPNQVDFFTEFVNLRQSIQSKIIADSTTKHRNEVLTNPYSRIPLNSSEMMNKTREAIRNHTTSIIKQSSFDSEEHIRAVSKDCAAKASVKEGSTMKKKIRFMLAGKTSSDFQIQSSSNRMLI